MGQGRDLFKVVFGSENNGWILGYGGIIVRTTDGGKTWFNQFTMSVRNFYDISILQEHYLCLVGECATLVTSSDSGFTLIANIPVTMKNLFAVKSNDEQKSLAVGWNGALIFTTNT